MGEDGEKHRPVMLHRAILGSLERFIGILIENYAGRLPLWLSPVHAVICTITNEADDYAHEVKAALAAKGLNVEVDTRNEKINYKVREHSHAKIPMILALGKREAEEKTASVRRIGFKHQKTFGIDEIAEAMAAEIRDRVIEADF